MTDEKKMAGIRSYPTHNVNPFADGKTNLSNGEGKTLITDTNTPLQALVIQRQISKEDWANWYVKDMLGFYFEMSKPAMAVMGHLIKNADLERMMVQMDYDKCLKESAYSSISSIFTGISELLIHNIIARAGNLNMYFLNPQVFASPMPLNVVHKFDLVE